MKREFLDKCKYSTKKLACPYEYFNSIDDYEKPVDILKKQYSFNELKNDYPDVEEIERTKQIVKMFNIKSGEELTQMYLKTDILLLACAFEKFIKISVNEFGNNPLYCVSLAGYTWQGGL